MSDKDDDVGQGRPMMTTKFLAVHEIHNRSGRPIPTYIGANVLLVGEPTGLRPVIPRVGIYQQVGEETRALFVMSADHALELAQALASAASHVLTAEGKRLTPEKPRLSLVGSEDRPTLDDLEGGKDGESEKK